MTKNNIDNVIEMLKISQMRQLITNNIMGPNVHFDGQVWRIAGNLDVPGAKITEECVRDILLDMIKEKN